MEKEVKRPLVWATRLEVWKFLRKYHRNHYYEIDPKHHLNMMELRGCSKDALAKYLECNHSISEDVILFLLKHKNTEMLQFWAEHAKNVSLSPETEKAVVAKFGFDVLLKNNIHLSEKSTLKFLQGRSLSHIPSSYLRCLTFSPNTEETLLKLKNPELACSYLCDRMVNDCNQHLILLYDDPDVYKAFARHNSFENILEDIIKTKSLEISKIALLNTPDLPVEIEKILVDTKNLPLLEFCINHIKFSDELIDYLAQHASDEVFETYVRHEDFSNIDSRDSVYQRLFEPRHLELLKEHLQEYCVPGKFEIRLLESGNKDLIDLYFQESFELSPEAKAWLMEHQQSEYAAKLLDHVKDLGYLGEISLFKSGDDVKIQHYIASHSLNIISEAALFKFASSQVVREHLNSWVPGCLAQIALVQRHDFELLKLLWTDDFEFDDAPLRIFLNEADDDTILMYLQYLAANYGDFSLDSDTDESENPLPLSVILHQRHLDKSAMFFVSNTSLTEADQCALAAYGAKEVVQTYLKEHDLCTEAEKLLLCRGDIELVRQYISESELYSDNEQYLFVFDDWDLINFYQEKHGFSDCDITEAMDN